MASNSAIPFDSDVAYTHTCFNVSILEELKTFAEITDYQEQDPLDVNGLYLKASKTALGSIATSPEGDGLLPMYYSRAKCRATSLGANDAINPLPQFNEDDDIAYQHYSTGKDSELGSTSISMGRVYSQVYDDNQQLVHMSLGLPIFNNIQYFYKNAVNGDLVNANLGKSSGTVLTSMRLLAGRSLQLLIDLPTVPIMFLNRILGGTTDAPITKYYEFVERMPLYIEYVNTILVTLGVNLRMLSTNYGLAGTQSQTGSTTNYDDYLHLYQSSAQNMSGLPDIFKNYHLDFLQVLKRKYELMGIEVGLSGKVNEDFLNDDNNMIPDARSTQQQANAGQAQSTNPAPSNSSGTTGDAAANAATAPTDGDMSNPPLTFVNNLITGASSAIHRSHIFVSFRVEKGLDSTETFSNEYGESQLAQTINQISDSGRQKTYSIGQFNTGVGFIDSALNGLSGMARSIIGPEAAGLTQVAMGAAKIDIPDVWTGSSFSKDISFELTCVAPYKDPVTILKSEYLPLAAILAAGLPRGTGANSWVPPFIARMYSPGFFSSPLCAISSIAVERGADEFGWTAQRLPGRLTIRVGVRDLSPVMYMYMGSTENQFKEIFGSNNLFSNYMMTLTGMGVLDQILPMKQMWRKAVVFGNSVWETHLNPFHLGQEMGDRFFGAKILSAFATQYVPNR